MKHHASGVSRGMAAGVECWQFREGAGQTSDEESVVNAEIQDSEGCEEAEGDCATVHRTRATTSY